MITAALPSGVETAALPFGGETASLPSKVGTVPLPSGVVTSSLLSGVKTASLPSVVKTTPLPSGVGTAALLYGVDVAALPFVVKTAALFFGVETAALLSGVDTESEYAPRQPSSALLSIRVQTSLAAEISAVSEVRSIIVAEPESPRTLLRSAARDFVIAVSTRTRVRTRTRTCTCTRTRIRIRPSRARLRSRHDCCPATSIVFECRATSPIQDCTSRCSQVAAAEFERAAIPRTSRSQSEFQT